MSQKECLTRIAARPVCFRSAANIAVKHESGLRSLFAWQVDHCLRLTCRYLAMEKLVAVPIVYGTYQIPVAVLTSGGTLKEVPVAVQVSPRGDEHTRCTIAPSYKVLFKLGLSCKWHPLWQTRLLDILKANYKFWIIPNIFAYRLPVEYRVPALSVLGFVWSIYCSHFAKKCGDDVTRRNVDTPQLDEVDECSSGGLTVENRDCLLGQRVFGDDYTPAANASAAAAALLAANAWANNMHVDEHGRPVLDAFGEPLKSTQLPDGSFLVEDDDAPRCGDDAIGEDKGRPGRRLLEDAIRGEERDWSKSWRERFDCWWLALPGPMQAKLGGCLGGVALHLGSRFDAALGLPSTHATDSSQGCEWLNEWLDKGVNILPALPDSSERPTELTLAPLVPWPIRPGPWQQLRQLSLLLWLRNNWADPLLKTVGHSIPTSPMLAAAKPTTPAQARPIRAEADAPVTEWKSSSIQSGMHGSSWLVVGAGFAAGSATAAAYLRFVFRSRRNRY